MTGLRLTVLGSAGSYPGAGRACSSYLVERSGRRVLLDCGNGSTANLRGDAASLDAVLLSHVHPDHVVDVYGLHIALRYGPRPGHVDVYAPAGAGERLAALLPADHRAAFHEDLRFHDVAAGDVLELGGMRAQLYAAAHPIEALAVRLEVGGRVIAYSGDSGPTPRLVACARNADLFVCDATWPSREGPFPEGLHCTGADAGRMAAEAGAQRLLVTHVQPCYDPEDVAAEAAAVFGGEVLVAHDRQEIEL